jgi:hypothetical protein
MSSKKWSGSNISNYNVYTKCISHGDVHLRFVEDVKICNYFLESEDVIGTPDWNKSTTDGNCDTRNMCYSIDLKAYMCFSFRKQFRTCANALPYRFTL